MLHKVMEQPKILFRNIVQEFEQFYLQVIFLFFFGAKLFVTNIGFEIKLPDNE